MNTKMLALVSSFLVVMGMGSATSALAAESSSFGATSSVVASCSIEKLSNVDLGSYSSLSATTNSAEGRFSVRCTRGSGVRFLVDQGLHARAGSTCTSPLRSMVSAEGKTLNYGLKLYWTDQKMTEEASCDLSRTGAITNFLNTPGGIFWNGNNHGDNFSLLAEIPGGQAASIGSYSDTVTVTLVF